MSSQLCVLFRTWGDLQTCRKFKPADSSFHSCVNDLDKGCTKMWSATR